MEIFSQIGFSRYKDHLPMVNAKRTAIFSAILMLGTSGCYQTHLYLEASEQPPEPDAVVRQISTLFATTELEEARALRTVSSEFHDELSRHFPSQGVCAPCATSQNTPS